MARTKDSALNSTISIESYKDSPEILVDGYHKGIVSEKVFREVEYLLKGKRRKHERKDNRQSFPLKEFLVCSVCNLSYTASVTTKNNGLQKYPYYHCAKTSGHDRYPVDLIHDCFESVLKEFKVKHEILSLYRKVLLDVIQTQNREINTEKDKLEAEIEKLKGRIRNIENKLADDTSNT